MAISKYINFTEKFLEFTKSSIVSYKTILRFLKAKDLEDHQKGCIYREIVCLDKKCQKQVLFKDFIEHVDSDHKEWNNEATKVDGKTFVVSFDKEVKTIER